MCYFECLKELMRRNDSLEKFAETRYVPLTVPEVVEPVAEDGVGVDLKRAAERRIN